MATIELVTISGDKKGSVSLKKAKTASPILVSTVVAANLSNKRRSIAHTKTKGEVSGGGKKPWRQKGLGRARAGSIRSPLWKGGGVTFGPRSNRNFSKRINKKQNIVALNTIMKDKVEQGSLKIIEDIKLDSPKTKGILSFLTQIGVDDKTLLILDSQLSSSKDGENIYLASRNINFLKVSSLDKLNAFNLLKFKWVVMTKKAFNSLNDRFGILAEEKVPEKPKDNKKVNKEENKD